MIGFILWLIERRKYKKRMKELDSKIDELTAQVLHLSHSKKSNEVRYGQMFEQFLPLARAFPFNLKDSHFLGSPIDYIVFDGLDEDNLKRVVFVEAKTGKAGLNAREKKVRDCIVNKQVEWVEMRDEK